MIRKLQAGMMPPPLRRVRIRRPTAALITRARTRPSIPRRRRIRIRASRTFQRLNRPEYARAVRDLLALDVDAGTWLPLDTKSANFDNIADEQALSPTLLESYLNAAADDQPHGGRRSQRAGRRSHLHQHELRVAAPVGSRRGRAVRHARRHGRRARVPGRRRVRVRSRRSSRGDNARFEDIDISIDGERVALLRYEPGRPAAPTAAAPCRSGPSRCSSRPASTASRPRSCARFDGPYEDLIRPHDWSFAGGGSGGAGITTLPHLRDLIDHGPVAHHRRLRDAEPPEDLHLPADDVRRKSGRARGTIVIAPRRRGLPPPADAAARSTA